ncbi:MAG: hypothetical protein AAFR44_13045, partial [Pseudomonadota bacterium]
MAACGACGFVYLANPPEAEALEAGEGAWEESFAAEAERRIEEAPAVYKLDVTTKQILEKWELTKVKRWAASPTTFTLDFGE